MLSCPAVSASQAPQVLWTNSDFSAPESVVYDSGTKSFYVSNVVGGPLDKDGQGWISKLSINGKTVKQKWASGLNAPKGMRIRGPILWVSDIDKVVGIQLARGRKTVSMDVPGAKFLNDIAFTKEKSQVLVSDMFTNKIHAITKGGVSVFSEGRALESPNGILVDGKELLIAPWGNDIQADFTAPQPGRVLSLDMATGKITPWTEASLGNLDGLEKDGPDAVLVSDWMAGKVFRLKKSGDCVTLLDGIKGAADIGFVPETRTLLVPAMSENKVTAYKLPKF